MEATINSKPFISQELQKYLERNLLWIVLLSLLHTICVQAQDEDPGFAAAPQVPSVGLLSTYIDIPVDYYTGIPKISYPTLSLPTRSKDVSFNMVLNYHPNNIAHHNSASDTGLGWSLIGVSAISRSVIGDPDEYYNFRPSIPANAPYDDEYYYNVQGHSGKFIFRRNPTTGTYTIQNLKPNKLKFEFVNSGHPGLEVTAFTVTDENGIKFFFSEFDIIPITNRARLNPGTFPCNSAFYLTKVEDANGLELATLEYDETYHEFVIGVPGKKRESLHKLKRINAHGFGKLEFSFTTSGHLRHTRNDISQLNSIVLKDMQGIPVRYANLGYMGANHQPKVGRPDWVRFLKVLELADRDNVSVEKYQFEYNLQTLDDHETDYFGFSKIIDTCNLESVLFQNPNAVLHGVLESVLLPTKGKIRYDFEPHRVNEIEYMCQDINFQNYNTQDNFNKDLFPDQLLTDNTFHNYDPSFIYQFDINPRNRVYDLLGEYEFNTPVKDQVFTFFLPEASEIYIVFAGTPYTSPFLTDPVYIDYSILQNNVIVEGTMINDQCLKIRRFSLQAGTHQLKLISNYGGEGTYTIYTCKPSTNLRKWRNTAGVRIKGIHHYTDRYSSVPVTSTTYEYEDFNDPTHSSGQLLMEKYIDDQNNIARVFYKNIKVSTGEHNGHVKYCYYSPYDSNATGFNGYLLRKYFAVLENGLLNYSEIYSHQSLLTRRDKYFYEVAKYDNLKYRHYSSYQEASNFYIENDYIKKSYVMSESYSYQPFSVVTNKSITMVDPTVLKPETTVTFDSNGNKRRTDYYYAHELPNEPNATALVALNNWGALLKKENSYAGQKVGEQKTIYKNWGNNMIRPELIQAAKSDKVPETVSRVNGYDAYGHVLETQQENGTKTSYVYGYSHTMPVAKVENMGYAAIPPHLIDAIHTASNDTAMGSALYNLRSDPAMAAAMVTTYAYKPLVGVSRITDPKGDTVTYIYDSFGRLKEVRDKENNLLSENEYQYRTQN